MGTLPVHCEAAAHDVGAGHGPSISGLTSATVGYSPPVIVPAPRLLIGVAASLMVLGLALTVSEADAALPAQPSAHAPLPVPVAAPQSPVGILVDPYTRAAAACQGLDAMILVAIHDVESGRDVRGGTSNAGAMGPMQFLPDTWMAYGIDADHDGRADVWDLNDALAGATHLLCANGVADPATRASAIWNYNHSWSYVRQVLVRVEELHAGTVPA